MVVWHILVSILVAAASRKISTTAFGGMEPDSLNFPSSPRCKVGGLYSVKHLSTASQCRMVLCRRNVCAPPREWTCFRVDNVPGGFFRYGCTLLPRWMPRGLIWRVVRRSFWEGVCHNEGMGVSEDVPEASYDVSSPTHGLIAPPCDVFEFMVAAVG